MRCILCRFVYLSQCLFNIINLYITNTQTYLRVSNLQHQIDKPVTTHIICIQFDTKTN